MSTEEILELLFQTHEKACERENASVQIFRGTYDMNGGDLSKALAAALMTFGGKHAPINRTFSMLKQLLIVYVGTSPEESRQCQCDEIIEGHLIHGRVPGLGSGFVKDKSDPFLEPLRKAMLSFPMGETWFTQQHLHQAFHSMLTYAERITDKTLYPNLAFYHAAITLLTKLTDKSSDRLFISARCSGLLKLNL